MSVDYDVSRAFKRIENELIDSMIRNLKRHQVEEIKEGLNWEQWQVLQLKELEKYRLNNPKLFAKDFSDVNKRVEDAFRTTYQSASTAEEAKILDMIRQGKIRNSHSGSVSADFFGFNEARFENLVTATKADFVRGEWSMLRQANDQYRRVIFDAQMYSATGATYAQAVDMATKDFLKNGIQSITYRNGSRHSVQEYASMAIRTGQKRAYLMGEGDAHDKYGIHTVRVNKRVDACPLCVKWLGRVLVDDVYAGGTFEEAQKAGVPLLSEAIDEGFLHPNCKDIYSMYVEGISQPAKPWTKDEMQEIADRYNAEQELRKAEDMQNSYDRMARNSLDKQNQQRYQARADAWRNRVDELKLGNPPPPIIPATPPKPPVVEVAPFTEEELGALEWYVSGDGMWINQYMRGRGSKELLETPLADNEKALLEHLKTATNRQLEDVGTLYRSVDAESILGDLSVDKKELLQRLYSDDRKVQDDIVSLFDNAKGKTITEKGFMSTTTDKELAVYWEDFTGAENPVVLEINTEGKAVKGAKIPKELEIAEDPQNEILLASNTKYKVKEVSIETAEDGFKYINVKVDIVDDVVEEIAEEAVETVAKVEKAMPPSAEEIARQNLADTKNKLTPKAGILEYKEAELKALKDAEKQWAELVRYGNDTKQNVVSMAQNRRQFSYLYKESDVKAIEYLEKHFDVFKRGEVDEVLKKPLQADIKPLKKEVKTLAKELDLRYDELEKVIGTPNVNELASYGEAHTKELRHMLDDADNVARNAWNANADKFKVITNPYDSLGRRRKGNYYSTSEHGVWSSIKKASAGNHFEKPYEVTFHEFAHNMDFVLNETIGTGKSSIPFTHTYNNGAFGKKIMEEVEAYTKKFGEDRGIFMSTPRGIAIQEADNAVKIGLIDASEKMTYAKQLEGTQRVDMIATQKELNKHMKATYSKSERASLSDMFEHSMIDKNDHHPFGFGHGRSYWANDPKIGVSGQVGVEAFAEMYASLLANPESLALIKEVLPESYKIFEEILEVANGTR